MSVLKGIELRGPRTLVPGAVYTHAPQRTPRRITLCFCAAFTPAATGADAAELPVPYGPNGEVLRFNVYAFTIHVGVAGGAPAASLEYSPMAGAFVATTITSATMSTGLNTAIGLGSTAVVQSGGFMRFNVSALGTATLWSVTADLEELVA